ncbi:hypothetical protein QJS04_geneDACA001543 [Acorus gramineus]|uniref:Polymerase nucleotidyl transferase domain-containing protein n=1 Tax=Acorus gramineus TaxID=55184 RepID=A0AAV9BGP7_ACOGR|nr:hypothetical protein QJS04_geneDACA001543 [Acorus gramineus]
MGEREGLADECPGGTGRAMRPLDAERLAVAEERTAELIARVRPTWHSEGRRNAVADYVERLISSCFACQVFAFGSVPLKTYLPDGDIDVSVFSRNQNLKDTWANKVRDVLEKEEKSEGAEFHVMEVQYIQAEVKIIKCLVENIVVDICFNQLSGLCTLCFLEEVDNLIKQNHLFKRSIILIKAWCYYESRILGAHHGLISTYGLEILVLYIFHVFNNTFAGPLEVLYRFLEFFSNFDWDNFCVSLRGPVPISSLPEMTAEPLHNDGGLGKLFLDACSLAYAVFPVSLENDGAKFIPKHFNVIDPLRTDNNLGRSVSKGNFFRIRSAFAFGFKRLSRLLECPKENLITELNQFFMNTWDRHGSGKRPDAPTPSLRLLQPLNNDSAEGNENSQNGASFKRRGENARLDVSHIFKTKQGNLSRVISPQFTNTISHPSQNLSRTSNVSTMSSSQSQKIYGNQAILRIADWGISSLGESAEKDQKIFRPEFSVSEHGRQGRCRLSRTQSTPSLTGTSSMLPSRGRHYRLPEIGKNQLDFVRQNQSGRRENLGFNVFGGCGKKSSDDTLSLSHGMSNRSLDVSTSPNYDSNNHHSDVDFSTIQEDHTSIPQTIEINQEEQDLFNIMVSSSVHNSDGDLQFPMSLDSTHLPSQSPPTLASMGYVQRNFVSVNVPIVETNWGSNLQFAQGLVSLPLSHCISGDDLASNLDELHESGSDDSSLTNMNQQDGDCGFWHEQDPGSRRLFTDNRNLQMFESEDRHKSRLQNPISSSGVGNSGSFLASQHGFARVNRGQPREASSHSLHYQDSRGSNMYATDKNANLRYSPVSQASSFRSELASESSWDGKVSKIARGKQGRKPASPAVSSSTYKTEQNKVQYDDSVSDSAYAQVHNDSRDWIPLSTMSTEIAEENTRLALNVTSHDRGHQIHGYQPSQMSQSISVVSSAPVPVGPVSQMEANNSGVLPFAFYPMGPPMPFLTMLPVHNFQSETGNSGGSTSPFDMVDGESAESLDHSEISTNSSSARGTSAGLPEDQESDIFNIDFLRHWHNLQYGRSCQSTQYSGPLVYNSSVMAPPVYLQDLFPWDGSCKPLSANGDPFSQLMSYDPQLEPILPHEHGSNWPSGLHHHYGDDAHRYRSGTGTYLPNPKVSFRNQRHSNSRNHRGYYNHDRNDHADRQGNWINSKSRAATRRGRNRAEKLNLRAEWIGVTDGQSDRWESHKHEQISSRQLHNSSYNSAYSRHGSTNMAYGMYPLPTANSDSIIPVGPAMSSVMMLRSGDQNAGCGSHCEQLEFGSLGPVHLSSVNEATQFGDGCSIQTVYEQRHETYQEGPHACFTPDQSSSPLIQRGKTRIQHHSVKREYLGQPTKRRV